MVEVIVALGVLLVALMGAYSAQATSSDLIKTSRETDLALSDLQDCMEQILTLAIDVIPIPDSDYEDDQPVSLYENLNLSNERIVASYPGYTVGQQVPDPLEIHLTITWNDYGSRLRTETLASVKVR